MERQCVLMVDDDQGILDGLRRSLHSLRKEWDFEFARSGAEALEKMARRKVDVIVSDMRMPGMDGAELLKEVSRRYPSTIRYVLSGYSDRELVLRVMGYAHRYLAKPCQPEMLANHIRSSQYLRESLLSDKLQETVARIGALPARPKLYDKLISKLQSETATISQIAELVSQDVSLSAKVLQIVNSAFFGMPRRVESISEAVNLLGFETIQGMVLTAGVFHEYNGPYLKELPIEPFYEHCLVVGAGAKTIAGMLGLEQNLKDDAMIAGMMHDIGKLVLLMHFTSELSQAYRLAADEDIPLYRAEINVLGVSHAEIGAYLLMLWGLAETVVEPVAFHHNPSQLPSQETGVLTAVHLADCLTDPGNVADTDTMPPKLDCEYLERLGLVDDIPRFRKALNPEPVAD